MVVVVGGGRVGIVVIFVGVPVNVSDVNRMVAVHGDGDGDGDGCLCLPTTTAISNVHCVGNANGCWATHIQFQPILTK